MIDNTESLEIVVDNQKLKLSGCYFIISENRCYGYDSEGNKYYFTVNDVADEDSLITALFLPADYQGSSNDKL